MFRRAMTIALALAGLAGATHFPLAVGNHWDFSYVTSVGGWGGGQTDSGSLRWEITDVEVLESMPPQTRVTIREVRSIVRSINQPMMFESRPGWDSTYDPARVTVDTVVLRGRDGDYGLWFEGDSCWSFVLDPSAGVGSAGVALAPVRVYYAGDSISAVEVRPDVCRYGTDTASFPLDCTEPDYFATAEGIGPVAYRSASPACLMDAYWYERWTLASATLAVGRGWLPAGRGMRVSAAGGGVLTIAAPDVQRAVVRAFALDGRERVLFDGRLGSGSRDFRLAPCLARGMYLVRVDMQDARWVAPVSVGR